MSAVVNYFLDLGFYPTEIEFGEGLPRKRMAWSLGAYALLFAGILAQQFVDLGKTPFAFVPAPMDWKVLVASAIVALALFPLFMHWFNSKRKQPSWEHLLWAFSFGFFVHATGSLVRIFRL